MWLILRGDARNIPMKDESVQCAVTSPPYWGLRDYGIPPLIWPILPSSPEPQAEGSEAEGGGREDCEHSWAVESVETYSEKGNWQAAFGGATGKNRFGYGNVDAAREQKNSVVIHGSCLHCSAWSGCLGLEPTPELYVEHLVDIFREVRRVLRKDGTLWLNMGDSYAGSWGNYHPNSPPGKHGQRLKETARWNRPAYESQEFLPPTATAPGLKSKDLCGMPWRAVFALQADGWWLRSDTIWSKPNPMPESITDRPTKAHEYLFLLTKSERYFYDGDAVREPLSEGPLGGRQLAELRGEMAPRSKDYHNGRAQRFSAGNRVANRNLRSVWNIATQPLQCVLCSVCGSYWDRGGPQEHCGEKTVGHFAAFPEELVEKCIKAGTSEKGACAKCGKPWARIVEKPKGIDRSTGGLTGWQSGPGQHDLIPKGRYGGKWSETDPQSSGQRLLANVKARRDNGLEHDNPFLAPRTLGWKPACKCGVEERRPCVVLDPFSGAGTTSLVSDKLGRIGIGMDLKGDYCRMARERVVRDAPLFSLNAP